MIGKIYDFLSGEVPGGFFLLIFILGIIIGFLYFFHRANQDTFSKKKFTIIASILTFIIVSIYGTIWYVTFPPPDKIRVAVLPYQNNEKWLKYAIPEVAGLTLQYASKGSFYVYTFEESFDAFDTDSLIPIDFAKKTKLNYLATGGISVKDKKLLVQTILYDVTNRKKLYEMENEIEEQDLVNTARNIAKELVAQSNLKSDKGENIEVKDKPEFPKKSLKYYIEGKINFLKGDYKSALENFKKSFKSDSTIPFVRMAWAEANAQYGYKVTLDSHAYKKKYNEKRPPMEFFAEAKRNLQIVTSHDSLDSEAHRVFGLYYVLREEWLFAEKELKKAYSLNPHTAIIHYALSKIHHSRYKDLGFKDEGKILDKAVKINPAFFSARIALANYYDSQGFLGESYKLAVDVAKGTVEMNSRSVKSLMTLGKIYLKRKEVINTLETYGRVLELEPDNPDAVYNMGISYFDGRRYDDAILFFEKAVEMGNQPDAHLYLGGLYEIKGNNEKAIHHYRERIKLKQGDDDKYAREAMKRLQVLVPEPDEE
jgi:tetratricopeptide (TPR) repeat protein